MDTPATVVPDRVWRCLLTLNVDREVIEKAKRLAAVTFRNDRAEPPPREEVLNRLKQMCMLDPKECSRPTDGTIHIEIQHTPCRILCQFDDTSDICCRMQMERLPG